MSISTFAVVFSLSKCNISRFYLEIEMRRTTSGPYIFSTRPSSLSSSLIHNKTLNRTLCPISELETAGTNLFEDRRRVDGAEHAQNTMT